MLAGFSRNISIHALREEGDAAPCAGWHEPDTISIHALREEGDMFRVRWGSWDTDFYPRPPRGGRPCLDSSLFSSAEISIHALREEGDS